MGTLSNEEMGNATGLYNLLRNVGGSIGISIVNTLIARHQQIHRAELAGNLGRGGIWVEQRLHALRQTFGASGPGLADTQAWGALERTLSSQSALWSYVDDFRYLAVACFCCVPIVFLLKRVRAKGGAAMAH